MMDPFTLATGIAGLSSLAIELSKLTTNYISTATNASNAIRGLYTELELLQCNLVRLRKFLETEHAIKEFDHTSILVRSCEACEKDLESLRDKLVTNHNKLFRKVLVAAKWPLQEKETRDTQQRLHAYCQAFEAALQIDAWL